MINTGMAIVSAMPEMLQEPGTVIIAIVYRLGALRHRHRTDDPGVV